MDNPKLDDVPDELVQAVLEQLPAYWESRNHGPSHPDQTVLLLEPTSSGDVVKVLGPRPSGQHVEAPRK